MPCESCGNKPKNDSRAFTKATVEINNPEELALLRKVVVPASMGDDTAYPPRVGKYCNVILYYEANDQVYIYSSDGIPTKVTIDIEELKRQIAKLRTDLTTETHDREAADQAIWTEIETIEAASDVVDVVGTYAELQQYDTSDLHDKDLIKVLQDETRDDAITYYRWSTSTHTFSYVGEEGPYYTQSQVDTKLGGKQDTLIAGTNIQIAADGKTISATDTTYSVFTGATSLTDGTSGLVPAPTTADPNKYLKGDGTWDDSWNDKVDSLVLYIHKTGGTFDGLYKDAQCTEKIYGYDVDSIFPNTRLFVKYANSSDPIAPVIRVIDSDEGYHVIVALESPEGGSYPPDSWTSLANLFLHIPSDLAHEQDVGGMNIYEIQKTNIQNQLTAGNNISFTNGGSVINATDTTYSAFTGATSQQAGTAGLVPAPTTSDPDKFLRGDGTWSAVDPGGTIFYFEEVQNDFFTFYTDSACTTVAKLQDMFDAMNKGSIYVQRVDSDTANLTDKYIYPLSLHMEVDKTSTPAEVTNLNVSFSNFSGVSVLSGWSNPTHLSDNMSSLTITHTPYITSLPAANASIAGIGKLYTSSGQNTDGAVTQKYFTDTVGDVESILQILNHGAGV